jgi:hypothetical protein
VAGYAAGEDGGLREPVCWNFMLVFSRRAKRSALPAKRLGGGNWAAAYKEAPKDAEPH